ncbi:MAG: hypothetical protein RBT34_10840 [Anaerolineaceae bacterium]|nr:hypothetical protein [Anaerolineaceae bacterium]
MRCSNCDRPLMEGDQFCPDCGQPVNQPVPPPVAQASAPVDKKRMPRWLLVVIILAVLILCCGVVVVGGYILFNNQAGAVPLPVENQALTELQATVSAQETQVAGQLADQQQPVEQPTAWPTEQSEAASSDTPNVVEGSVKIWFDESLMQGVRVVTVDPEPPGGYVPWDYHPMHLSLEVQNPKGFIHFVPVDAYLPMGDFAKETMRDLEAALENRPGVAAWGCIPTWDFPCPHQEMNINVSYFNFQNGSGIRSVTVYAVQNTSAINNEAIDYYYNGLTENGDFYVYAHFDLRHTSLSDDDWELPMDVMTEAEALKEYVITNGEMLESSADEYQPKLDVLDAVIQSLRVEAE